MSRDEYDDMTLCQLDFITQLSHLPGAVGCKIDEQAESLIEAS